MSSDHSSLSQHLGLSSSSSSPFPFTLTLAANYAIYAAAAAIAALFLARFFAAAAAGLSHDAREPPLVEVRFPVLGHMVGHTVNLLRYGKRYALMLK